MVVVADLPLEALNQFVVVIVVDPVLVVGREALVGHTFHDHTYPCFLEAYRNWGHTRAAPSLPAVASEAFCRPNCFVFLYPSLDPILAERVAVEAFAPFSVRLGPFWAVPYPCVWSEAHRSCRQSWPNTDQ